MVARPVAGAPDAALELAALTGHVHLVDKEFLRVTRNVDLFLGQPSYPDGARTAQGVNGHCTSQSPITQSISTRRVSATVCKYPDTSARPSAHADRPSISSSWSAADRCR